MSSTRRIASSCESRDSLELGGEENEARCFGELQVDSSRSKECKALYSRRNAS